MNENPLVSVVVITYNSARTVIETLDSISQQTYKNIELIVSDDGSKDETVELVKEWMSQHEKDFVDSKLLTVAKNTGTACNCNRGYYAAKGQWIKGIAGDDMLMPECIERFVKNTIENPDVDIFFSRVQGFDKDGLLDDSKLPFKYSAFNLNKEDFLILLTLGNFIPAPGCFLNTECFKRLGGFDENIKVIEDWPFWIKALYHKTSYKFIDGSFVLYRISEQSISNVPIRSKIFLESGRKAERYASSVRRKINFWLWLWGVCSDLSREKFWLLHIFRYIRLFNPIVFKLVRLKVYNK